MSASAAGWPALKLGWPGVVFRGHEADIDLAASTVRVRRSLTELESGALTFGPPKSDAGNRLVVFPELIIPGLTGHLANFVGTGADAIVFTTPTGALLRRSNFRRRVWLPALSVVLVPAIHSTT